ncbi:hypothetical protein WJX79_009333 [Trebouxia sp. C0005]
MMIHAGKSCWSKERIGKFRRYVHIPQPLDLPDEAAIAVTPGNCQDSSNKQPIASLIVATDEMSCSVQKDVLYVIISANHTLHTRRCQATQEQAEQLSTGIFVVIQQRQLPS